MNSTCVTDSLPAPQSYSQGGQPPPQAVTKHLTPAGQGGLGGVVPGSRQSPASLAPSLCGVFMQGYSDCAHEALRFLIEEEGLPFHHPMVVGLYEHLRDQQRLLYLQYCLRAGGLAPAADTSTGKHVHHPSKHSGPAAVTNVLEAVCKRARTEQLADVLSGETGDRNITTVPEVNKGMNAEQTKDSIAAIKTEEGGGHSRGDTADEAPDETEQLAMEIAEELFCLLQNDDSDGEEDEGFEDSDSIHS